MKLLLLSIISIICLASCSNQEELASGGTTKYLKKKIRDGKEIEFYEYYPDNSLKNLLTVDEYGDLRYKSQFEYSDSLTVEYRYDVIENELLRSKHYYWVQDSVGILDIIAPDGEITHTYTYEYGNDCGITKKTYETFESHIEYVDSNCSSIKVDTFFLGNTTTTRRYTRSDYRGVTIDIPTNCFGKSQMNAVTSLSSKMSDSNFTYTEDSEYKLNEYGNIIEETQTTTFGTVIVFEYEYY